MQKGSVSGSACKAEEEQAPQLPNACKLSEQQLPNACKLSRQQLPIACKVSMQQLPNACKVSGHNCPAPASQAATSLKRCVYNAKLFSYAEEEGTEKGARHACRPHIALSCPAELQT